MRRPSSRYRGALSLLLLLLPRVLPAHPGQAPEPHDLWSAWSFAPIVVVGLALCAWFYWRGIGALWQRGGVGRSVKRWRVAVFAGGLLAVAFALLSPIDTVGSVLFSVHMTQHLLLVLVAAPLIVLGQPLMVTLWALPVSARRAVGRGWRRATAARALWRAISHPITAWTLHVVALWLWHLPRLYDAALRDDGIHELEHATFFLTALLFWQVLLDHRRHRPRLGVAAFYLLAAGIQGTILGALIALAPHPLYLSHLEATAAWGLTTLEDQQLAGLIMWIPSGLVYFGALIPIAIRALVGGSDGARVTIPAATPGVVR